MRSFKDSRLRRTSIKRMEIRRQRAKIQLIKTIILQNQMSPSSQTSLCLVVEKAITWKSIAKCHQAVTRLQKKMNKNYKMVKLPHLCLRSMTTSIESVISMERIKKRKACLLIQKGAKTAGVVCERRKNKQWWRKKKRKTKFQTTRNTASSASCKTTMDC